MNIWILTEERPKREVIEILLTKFSSERNLKIEINSIHILPEIENGHFKFRYEVKGINCESVNNIFLLITSSNSSFVDYLIFYQENMPDSSDTPIYAIEETKTDDAESRNTGVYQRCSKFVYIEYFYPETQKIMLYNLKIMEKDTPTDSNIFGTRMLLTLGVEIIGKHGNKDLTKFESIDELIEEKNKMKRPPKGNVPVTLSKYDNTIEITGRLVKAGTLSHDPNIGMLTIISKCLRSLGWEGEIVISEHGLQNQKQVGKNNKFIKIANKVGIKLKGLSVPTVKFPTKYWSYDNESEKIATIFLHIIVEEFTNSEIVFENHAGGEKGYFITPTDYLQLIKYEDRELYKSGDKSKRVAIPDLIIKDNKRNMFIICEGKVHDKEHIGVITITTYQFILENYIVKYYTPEYIMTTVVLSGGTSNSIDDERVGFLLNRYGKIILGEKSPPLFHEAVDNMLS